MENGVSSEGPPAYSLEDPNSPVSESWEPVVSEPHPAFPLVPRHPASARPLSLAGRASTAGPSSATPLNLPSSSRPPPSIRTRSAPTTGRSFTPRPFSDTQWSAPNRSASFPSRSTPLQPSRRVDSRPNTVVLTLSHPSNSDFIVRDANGHILYWVVPYTDSGVCVYKPGPSDQKDLLAKMVFHRWDPSFITLNGTRQQLRNLFRPKDWPSTSRLMPTPNGLWKWSSDVRTPQLWDEERKLILRYIIDKEPDRRGPSQPMIQLDYKALDNLDLVILGLIVEREDIKRGPRQI